MLDGANWREEKEWERAAWVTSHLLNVSGKVMKKRMTPDRLLGRKARSPVTFEDKVLSFEEIIRRQREIDANKGASDA